jgi:hypothetical protein
MIVNSCGARGGIGEVTPLTGEDEVRFGGEGVIGRPRPCSMGAIGGLRAESDEAETLSSSDMEAKADSMSVE